MVAVIVSVGLVDDTRSQLIPSLISLAVVLGAAWFVSRRRGDDRAPAAGAAQATGLKGERPGGETGAFVRRSVS